MRNDYDEEVSYTREKRSRKKPSKQSKTYQSDSEYAQRDQFYFDDEDDLQSSADVNQIQSRIRRKQRMQSEAAASLDKSVKPKKSYGRLIRIVVLILAECLTLFGIFSYAFVARTMNLIQRQDFKVSNVQNEDLTVEDLTKMKGYWMIAVFGVDSRGTNVGKGTNADVNMICCINRDTGEIKLVSVFRDSYLNISDKNTYNKINAAYAQGGPEQAVKALNKNLDLNITDYITFNWKAVADSINILGGVDMEINKSEFRYINSFITETVKSTGIGSHQLKSAGVHHLDGVQAVAYGRLRLMDSDFARTERQRKVIEKAFEKAKVADYTVLNNILVVVLPQVATSLDFADLTDVALNVTKYKMGDTAGFPMARGDSNMGSKGACVIPKTLESNVIELHNFLFGNEDYKPTEAVKTISAKIAADTGMYKAGSSIGHVSTEGYIPKETSASKTTEETEESTKQIWKTDEDGNIIWETEEDGSIIAPTDDSGESGGRPSIGETDEDGNPVDPRETGSTGPGGTLNPSNPTGTTNPTKPTTPGSSLPQESTTKPTAPTAPTNPDEWTGPGTNPTQPTTNPTTNPTKPSGTVEEPSSSTTNPTPGGPNGPNINESERELGGSTVITIPSTQPTTEPSPREVIVQPSGTSKPGGSTGP